MAPPTVYREWLLLLVCAAASAQLGFGQEDESERTADGKVRGPNSKLAKRAEMLMPIIMGVLIVVIVFGFFFIKVRAAIRKVRQEELDSKDVEMATKSQDLSESTVERITRPVVWDKSKAWDKGSNVSVATSVASSSSQDEGVSKPERKARGDRALRQASKLPRNSAGGEDEEEPGRQRRERRGRGDRGSSKNSRRGSSGEGRRHDEPVPQDTDEIVFVHQ